MKILKSLGNYLGDYAPITLDHKQYEDDVLSHGADSGAELYEYCVKIIDQKFPQGRGLKILDLACGRGPFGEYVKKVGRDYIMDGIDIFVPEKQEVLERKIYNKIIEADILKFDFSTIKGQYDLIVSNQFFEHLWPDDSFRLLYGASQTGAAILISVPLSYQTFAYSKDYLKASLKENHDFSELLSVVTGAEVHKTYFTRQTMKKLGFMVMPDPVFHSNFFFRPGGQAMEKNSVNISGIYRMPQAGQVEQYWQSLLGQINPRRTKLPLRENYEKQLTSALLLEPVRYKIIRKMIYFFTQPLRKVLKLIK